MADDLDRTLAELTQLSPLERRTIVLHPDRLELAVHGLIDRFRTPFYLHSIAPEPDRLLYVPWRMFAAAAILGGAALALRVWNHQGAAFVTAGLALALALAQLPRIRRLLVYCYRAVGDGPSPRLEPHLYLLPDKPSREEVSRFVEVVAAAHEARNRKLREEESPPIPYTRELQRFAELRELKVVSQEEFDAVKAKLLNLKPRRIGF